MKHNVFSIIFFSLLSFVFGISALQAKESESIYYFKAGFPQQAKKLLLQDLSSGTDVAETCFYLGEVYFGDNKPDSASYYYNQGLKADPTFLYNQVGLAKLQIKNNPSQSSQVLGDLLKGKNKKNVDLIIEIGRAYLSAGDTDLAMTYEQKAELLKNKYAAVYVLKGDIYLAKKDPGQACTNYESAIYFDKTSKVAYIKYARAYRDVNTDLAIQKLNDLKAVDPSFSLANKELAELYYSKNRFSEAQKAFGDYVASGNDTDQDLIEYAMTVLLNGDYQKCYEIAQKGLNRNPNNAVFNRFAMYSLIELKKYDEAIPYADKFFKLMDPKTLSYFDYMYDGRLLNAEKKFIDAGNAFEKAVSIDSTKTELYNLASDAYSNGNDLKSSVIAYGKYIKGIPVANLTAENYVDYGKKLYSLGTSKTVSDSEKISWLEKADSVLTKATILAPDDYRGFYYRGHTNLAMDPQYTKDIASQNYLKAMEIAKSKNDPRYNPIISSAGSQVAIYYYFHSVKTKSEADRAECRRVCNEVLSIDPGNDTCKKLLVGLK